MARNVKVPSHVTLAPRSTEEVLARLKDFTHQEWLQFDIALRELAENDRIRADTSRGEAERSLLMTHCRVNSHRAFEDSTVFALKKSVLAWVLGLDETALDDLCDTWRPGWERAAKRQAS